MEKTLTDINRQANEMGVQHDQIMREVNGVLQERPRNRIPKPSDELLQLERYVNSLTADEQDGDVVLTPRPLLVPKSSGKPPIPPRGRSGFGPELTRTTSDRFPMWAAPPPLSSIHLPSSLARSESPHQIAMRRCESAHQMSATSITRTMSPFGRSTPIFTPYSGRIEGSQKEPSDGTGSSRSRDVAGETFKAFQKNAFRPYGQ